MDRVACEIRTMREDERSLLFLMAEEVLKPLADGSGHTELYRGGDMVGLLESAEVFVAAHGDEPAGFVAVHGDPPALLVDCLCVGPAHEDETVAHQLMNWVEGLAFNRRLTRLEALVPDADQRSQDLFRGHEFVRQSMTDKPGMVILQKRLPEPID